MNPRAQQAALAVLLAGSSFFTSQAVAAQVTVDVFDVGQGDSILIRAEDGSNVLIDAGDGKTPIVPLLQALGVQKLDLVVSTHPHADHIGGMQRVIEALPVSLYVDNGFPHDTVTYTALTAAVVSRKIPYKKPKAGETLVVGKDLDLKVLFPNKMELRNTRSDLNANSVVLRMDVGSSCMLFMGDAEEPTETRVASELDAPCEVLKVPHHGGNYSSTDALLAAAKPKTAIISVGKDNRYGHPGLETLKRLAHQGTTVYRTDLSGNLRLLFDEDGVEVLEQVSILPTPPPATVSPAVPPAAPGLPAPAATAPAPASGAVRP